MNSSSESGPTACGSTVCARAASSNQGALSSVCRCTEPSLSWLSAPRQRRPAPARPDPYQKESIDMTATPSSAARVQFPLAFGLDTFGDVTHDEDDRPLSHAQTIRNIAEGVEAEGKWELQDRKSTRLNSSHT